MILIDALYVNNGGAKVLLDYLVEEIEKKKLDVFYLFDARCKDSYLEIPDARKLYLRSSFYLRHLFYKKNRFRFHKILCFANLPPSIKIRALVFTYFHQPMYLNVLKEFSFIERTKLKCKILILQMIAKNTNYWIVQSDFIKDGLSNKFDLSKDYILIVPFYREFINNEFTNREKLTYLYVSNPAPHKNHRRLIEVFCVFYDKYKLGKLLLTVNESNNSVLELIKAKQKLHYPINNIGFVGRDELRKYYLSSEFLIFPSLNESFGLGLIEGLECGCKIIGADLPYTFEVCEPSIVFNPTNSDSFLHAFEFSASENVKVSTPKIKNKIDELLTLLQNN